jgi:hypothetical protein
MIFSAIRIRDRGDKSITCFSKARTVMSQIEQKKTNRANAELPEGAILSEGQN